MKLVDKINNKLSGAPASQFNKMAKQKRLGTERMLSELERLSGATRDEIEARLAGYPGTLWQLRGYYLANGCWPGEGEG